MRGGKLKTIWDNASKFGRIVIVGTAVVVVLLIIGAAFGDSENGNDEATPPAKKAGAADGRGEPEADAAPAAGGSTEATRDHSRRGREIAEKQAVAPSPEERAHEALGDTVSSDVAVGDSDVRSVKAAGQLLDVVLSTPEGGFEGPSTDDTDGLASAAFAKVYEDADWRGATFVEFRGGLVDSATGKPLPNAPTASYRVERGEAKRIDWSDDEALFNIDWGIYRAFCHPAVKGC